MIGQCIQLSNFVKANKLRTCSGSSSVLNKVTTTKNFSQESRR